ncbi:hypothetical protein HNP84_002376 [Thermocatellispora tengchongensis]|uniref:Uncharacterized protein n=1 Tax=Thermocatellispora tengchongensis TaxID=1073253 RepID=A0A840P5A5_9ACTN|nr:hypothetical protein [Thermocatellispora tengchongensis]
MSGCPPVPAVSGCTYGSSHIRPCQCPPSGARLCPRVLVVPRGLCPPVPARAGSCRAGGAAPSAGGPRQTGPRQAMSRQTGARAGLCPCRAGLCRAGLCRAMQGPAAEAGRTVPSWAVVRRAVSAAPRPAAPRHGEPGRPRLPRWTAPSAVSPAAQRRVPRGAAAPGRDGRQSVPSQGGEAREAGATDSPQAVPAPIGRRALPCTPYACRTVRQCPAVLAVPRRACRGPPCWRAGPCPLCSPVSGVPPGPLTPCRCPPGGAACTRACWSCRAGGAAPSAGRCRAKPGRDRTCHGKPGRVPGYAALCRARRPRQAAPCGARRAVLSRAAASWAMSAVPRRATPERAGSPRMPGWTAPSAVSPAAQSARPLACRAARASTRRAGAGLPWLPVCAWVRPV